MILAAEFSRNANARASDFTTSKRERGVFILKERRRWSNSKDESVGIPESNLCRADEKPQELKVYDAKTHRVCGALIAQFAANDPVILADAVELISPYVDGVDLNCGCPQEWAIEERIGSWLLREPQKVAEMVKAVKMRVGNSYPGH